jgi:hypothetical protein
MSFSPFLGRKQSSRVRRSYERSELEKVGRVSQRADKSIFTKSSVQVFWYNLSMSLKKIWSSTLIFLGFWLSPLSPWNDLFTNIPLAYGFAFLFSFGIEVLFIPAFVAGYWLSNILGFILMHHGYVHMKDSEYSFKQHWKSYILATTLYTVTIVIFIQMDILPSIGELSTFLGN